tara:strand:- start:1244 stop:1420 length:177 start_codon:yes stop_codon:yes gene_type:complete
MKNLVGKRCKMLISIEDINGMLLVGSKVKIEEYIDKENVRVKDMSGRIFWVDIKQLNV